MKFKINKLFSTLLPTFLLINCSAAHFNVQDRTADTYLIVNTIIKPILERSPNDLLVSDLKKQDYYFSKKNLKDGIIVPINQNGIPDVKLLDLKTSENCFSRKDYRYMLKQYKNREIKKLDLLCKKNYTCVTEKQLNSDIKIQKRYENYEFSTPYFSRDNTTAYIELNYQSAGIYGDGTAYVLKKRNSKWEIVGTWGTWIQ